MKVVALGRGYKGLLKLKPKKKKNGKELFFVNSKMLPCSTKISSSGDCEVFLVSGKSENLLENLFLKPNVSACYREGEKTSRSICLDLFQIPSGDA